MIFQIVMTITLLMVCFGVYMFAKWLFKGARKAFNSTALAAIVTIPFMGLFMVLVAFAAMGAWGTLLLSLGLATVE